MDPARPYFADACAYRPGINASELLSFHLNLQDDTVGCFKQVRMTKRVDTLHRDFNDILVGSGAQFESMPLELRELFTQLY